MKDYGSLPRARQDGLLEEAAGEELLLYDQESHTAHCLSPVAMPPDARRDRTQAMSDVALLIVEEKLLADGLLDEAISACSW